MTTTSSGRLASPTYGFEVKEPGKGTPLEKFECCKSYEKEIKELATGHSYGWKLMWMSGTKERDACLANDNMEILAVIARSSSWSATKRIQFTFLGTGITGTVGEIWETMAVGFSPAAMII